jgi:uncharacterized membrane protein YfcA
VDAALVLSLALSGVIGFALGVFGGGGSMLAVPMLVFVARVAPSAAIGMSLAIVGATSLTVGYAYHRRRRVRLKVGLLFGSSGIMTAFLGARLTHTVPGDVLMLSFAVLMVLVGCWMLLSARRTESNEGQSERGEPRRPRMMHAVLAGAAVGGITGFLGVGGGFLVVPALIAFGGLGMREAVGTSLLVIAINSAAGFVGHLDTDGLNLPLVSSFTVAAVLGGLLGERLARSLSIAKLRRGFALFVIAVGIAVTSSAIVTSGASAEHAHAANPSWAAWLSQERTVTMSKNDSIESAHVVLFERDDGIAMLGIIDPVQQLNAPDGPLADIAHEIGERLARVAQKLDA